MKGRMGGKGACGGLRECKGGEERGYVKNI